jgi:hypothetical protein
VRPEDFQVTSDGPLAVSVTSSQYHGSEFYCSGMTADGTELWFRSKKKVQKGDAVRLAADPSRVLVYAKAVS